MVDTNKEELLQELNTGIYFQVWSFLGLNGSEEHSNMLVQSLTQFSTWFRFGGCEATSLWYLSNHSVIPCTLWVGGIVLEESTLIRIEMFWHYEQLDIDL